MYKITLKDGTEINDLQVNGTCFVSPKKIDEEIFTRKSLSEFTVNDGETSTVYHDVAFTSQFKQADGWYLAFREITREEKLDEIISALDNQMVQIQLALCEVYEASVE